MSRPKRDPAPLIAPVASKKQLLNVDATCTFLGGMSVDSLANLRADKAERFPPPVQILTNPMWSVEALEQYVARKEREVSKLAV